MSARFAKIVLILTFAFLIACFSTWWFLTSKPVKDSDNVIYNRSSKEESLLALEKDLVNDKDESPKAREIACSEKYANLIRKRKHLKNILYKETFNLVKNKFVEEAVSISATLPISSELVVDMLFEVETRKYNVSSSRNDLEMMMREKAFENDGEYLRSLLSDPESYFHYKVAHELDDKKDLLKGSGMRAFSPSIAFTFSLLDMPFKKFLQEVEGKRFTPNELGVAVFYGMELKKFAVIFAQADKPSEIPVFVADLAFKRALNIADIAAAKLNLEVLMFLESVGITPTNLPGWGTGLDYAIHADTGYAEMDKEKFKNWNVKQRDVVRYLIGQGYSAHADFIKLSKNKIISGIEDLLSTQKFIEYSDFTNKDIHVSLSGWASSLKELDKLEIEIKTEENRCEAFNKGALKEKYLLSYKEAQDIINSARMQSGEQDHQQVMQALHDKDPELARRYAQKVIISEQDEGEYNADFYNALRQEDKRHIEQYVSLERLNQFDTDTLFDLLVDSPQLISAWRLRVEPLPPSSLNVFRLVSKDKLHKLKEESFDFEIRDKWGQDLFSVAIFYWAEEQVEYLLDNVNPTNPEVSSDALDLLLDKIYLSKRVPAYSEKVAVFFPDLEKSHKSRLSRLKLFRKEQYSVLIGLSPQLALKGEHDLNLAVFSDVQ